MKGKRAGTKKGSRTLTIFDVRAIKNGLKDGTQGCILAQLHHTTASNVSLIKKGKRWKEVKV